MSDAARAAETGIGALVPGVVAAVSFGFADGAAPLTVSAVRGAIGVGLLAGWLRLRPPARPHDRAQRWMSILLGVIYAANIYGVLKAIQLVPVPIAILSYFVYPLLTGIAGAALGIEPLGAAGLAAALVA